MNAKHFLFAHGEKVALSLTVLVCALQLAVTFTDESVRPTKVTPADIDAKNTAIDAVFNRGKPPVLKPVPPYLSDMDTRLAKTAPVIQEAAWLSAPPDRGPAAGGVLLYVFELPAPTLQAVDAVGHVDLTVALPEAVRASGKRQADGLTASWELSDGARNSAAVVGVRIESHRGDGVFRPLAAKGVVDGFVPLETLTAANGVLRIDGLEPWVKHSFRARLVAKATGLDLNDPTARGAHSVVLGLGRLTSVEPGSQTELPWADFTTRVLAKEPATLAKLAKPERTVPAGLVLAANESLYQGQESPVADVQVTSDIRFILDKIGTDINDPAKEVAVFLVTKQFQLKEGGKAWLKEPQSFRAAKEEVIGGMVSVVTPLSAPSKQSVNLGTGFKVVEIKRGQERILYWEIREKARAGGGKGKDLVLEKKTAQTDLVVVENPRSHAQLVFMKAQLVKPPQRADAITFPYLPAQRDEEGEFRADPSLYAQAEMSPAEPKKHPPEGGPLAKLRDQHSDSADLYSTDTEYYELGDGRLVWWDPLNRKVIQNPEPKLAPAAVTPPAPGMPPVVPGIQPGGQPRPPQGGPGVPPGGMPGAPGGGAPQGGPNGRMPPPPPPR